MHISKELLEKYHDGTCSADEKIAVEAWLMGDEADAEMPPISDESKVALRDEMWEQIITVLPDKEENQLSEKHNVPLRPMWWRIAASVILVTALGAGWLFVRNSRPDIIVMHNTSDTVNKNVHSNEFTIMVGPKSNVEINSQTGVIDFCGAMMINPKEDIEFTIQGTCDNPTENIEKVSLKKGLKYVALNYSSNAHSNEVIILEEGSMMSLPPLVMKQLLYQFDI